MIYTGRHIAWLIIGTLMLVLLSGCSSHSSEPDQPQEKPVLKIYIFAPDNPIVTRAETGDVDASEEESAINTLSVWAFDHDNKTLIGYVHVANQTIESTKEIAMEVSDEFANNPNKPRIDIFVAANVTQANCGLALGRSTSFGEVKDAIIGSDYFGLTQPVTSVPVEGLPMSGWLANQQVSGSAPVFSARSSYVKLVRSVSKMRFVFSKSNAAPAIGNLTVKLNTGMIPNQEYLFLSGEYDTEKFRIGSEYAGEATLISDKSSDDINSCTDPSEYEYLGSESRQQYETRINTGITEDKISELGRYYLRESDKRLSGKITYNIGETRKEAEFYMTEGDNFTRNHTWIVYGYFMGNGNLKLNVVDVKGWDPKEESGKLYNW